MRFWCCAKHWKHIQEELTKAMDVPFLIARRIHQEKSEGNKTPGPAITIATVGVAIGLAVMIISVFVILGFKHTIRNKVIGFGAHIQVTNFMAQMSATPSPIVIDDSMLHVIRDIPGVKHVERYAYTQGILKTDSDFLGVMFKGVGPEFDSTFLHRNLISGSIPQFSDQKSSNQLVVSQYMANKLRLKRGQQIFAYFIGKGGVRMRRFTIRGIYETNLAQYDESICFTDLYTAVKLNGWEPDQASGAEITVADFGLLDQTEEHFIQKINRTADHNGETYTSQTIRDTNPQIFNWLDLLDMNVWIILALMIAVAGVTMVSGLLIIILERTAMIGILKALGARNRTIRHIFLWLATFIIGRGLIVGNLIGVGLSLLQKWTGIVKLDAATYYVSTVPIEVNIPLLLLLNVGTLLICVLVLVVPSFIVSRIYPAASMHYE